MISLPLLVHMHVEKPEGLLLEKHLVIVESFSEVTPIGRQGSAKPTRSRDSSHACSIQRARHPLGRLPLRKDCQIIPPKNENKMETPKIREPNWATV